MVERRVFKRLGWTKDDDGYSHVIIQVADTGTIRVICGQRDTPLDEVYDEPTTEPCPICETTKKVRFAYTPSGRRKRMRKWYYRGQTQRVAVVDIERLKLVPKYGVVGWTIPHSMSGGRYGLYHIVLEYDGHRWVRCDRGRATSTDEVSAYIPPIERQCKRCRRPWRRYEMVSTKRDVAKEGS